MNLQSELRLKRTYGTSIRHKWWTQYGRDDTVWCDWLDSVILHGDLSHYNFRRLVALFSECKTSGGIMVVHQFEQAIAKRE